MSDDSIDDTLTSAAALSKTMDDLQTRSNSLVVSTNGDPAAVSFEAMSGATSLRPLTPVDVRYANADELTDFGAAQASLSIRVTQVSATVGRGFPNATTLAL